MVAFVPFFISDDYNISADHHERHHHHKNAKPVMDVTFVTVIPYCYVLPEQGYACRG
ncbi:hypothetical protein FEMY_23600 [Ferrovum myxofaciens]|jgi:hypothetical protein|uniref:Uncharacterized protein n=1 Tax=Ferrovum myxofaciens TaxID=416213 RepID=A0A149VV74_9PROT|nr:hypothetical protein FEMY_23600 [Ferrovum myxofaciens]